MQARRLVWEALDAIALFVLNHFTVKRARNLLDVTMTQSTVDNSTSKSIHRAGREAGTRIGTLNVHGWADSRRGNNASRIEKLLKDQNLDIIMLQEAKPKRKSLSIVRDLALHLGLRHFVSAGEMAILSRFPMTNVFLVPRDGSNSIQCAPTLLSETRDSRRYFARMLSAEIALSPKCCLGIINVHLDYQREPLRLREMSKILRAAPHSKPTLLCGDFNALTRNDYDLETWQNIANIRSKNAWEAPVTKLTDRLIDMGWGDCRTVDPNIDVRGENQTCRFQTRVDYIFMNKRGLEDCEIVNHDHIPIDATDHALVVATIRLPNVLNTVNPSMFV